MHKNFLANTERTTTSNNKNTYIQAHISFQIQFNMISQVILYSALFLIALTGGEGGLRPHHLLRHFFQCWNVYLQLPPSELHHFQQFPETEHNSHSRFSYYLYQLTHFPSE